MKRAPMVLVAVAALIGYCALAWLGITVIQQGSELKSLEARLPSPAPVLTPSPTASPSPSPSFAEGAFVADNLGHTWIFQAASYPPVTVSAKTNVSSRAAAQDLMNRQIKYAYTVNTATTLPSETVLCGWGGPNCSWTVPSTPSSIGIRVYFRLVGMPHRLSGPGAFGNNDGAFDLPFQVSAG